MKLVADSGSTKTHFCLLNRHFNQKNIVTEGINPFYQSKEEIFQVLVSQLLPHLNTEQVDEVTFYGAGCGSDDKKSILKSIFGVVFPKADISVESDLLGAARSLFGTDAGIACILGTGSNSCLYDGTKIVQNVSPLGFILGDEGSGAVIGRHFVADCLKNLMPLDLYEDFFEEYKLSKSIILEHAYQKPFPNRYFANFMPYILQNISETSIHQLVYKNFDAFFVRNLAQYPTKKYPLSFVGSVAYFFKDVLLQVATDRKLKISNISQNPIEGLIKYHGK